MLDDDVASVASPEESRQLERFLSSVVGSKPSYLHEVFLLLTRCREGEGLACFVTS